MAAELQLEEISTTLGEACWSHPGAGAVSEGIGKMERQHVRVRDREPEQSPGRRNLVGGVSSLDAQRSQPASLEPGQSARSREAV